MKRTKTLLLFLGFVLIFCTIAVISSDLFLAPMVQRLIVKTVKAELGVEVSVEAVSGTYFRDLKLSGLQTVAPSKTGALVSIGAAAVHARYSLPRLMQGMDAFLGELRLEIDEAHVKMDFSREGSTGEAEDVSPPALALPAVRVRNSVVDLRGRDWKLVLSGTDCTMEVFDTSRGGFPLTVHAGKSVIELPFMRPQTPELAASGLLTRDSVSIDGLEVNGRTAIEKARFDYAPSQPFRCTVSFSAFDGSGDIRAAFTNDSTLLEWNILKVNVFSVASLLVLEEPLLKGRITSNGSLAGDFSEPESLTGKVSFKMTDGSVGNIPFNRLALSANTADGVMRISSFDAEKGRNTASAAEVSLPMKALLNGDTERMARNMQGRFSARLEDVPALLTMVSVSVPKHHFPRGIPPHRLVMAGEIADGAVTLKSGDFFSGSGTVTLERFEATLPPIGPLLAGLNMTGKLSANITDLGRTAAIFGVDNVGGQLKGEAVFKGPLKKIKGSFEIYGSGLRYGSVGAASLRLAARSDPAGWRIVDLVVARSDDRLTGRGVVAMNPVIFKDMTLELTLQDFHPYLGWFSSEEVPSAHGRLDAHLDLSGPPAAPKIGFKAMLTDATVQGVSFSRGELAGIMTGKEIEITSLSVRTPEGQMVFAGSFRHRAWGTPITGTIARLELAAGEDTLLQLQEPVPVRIDGKTSWSFAEAVLQGDAGTFRLKGGASTRTGYDISFQLGEVRSAPLQSLLRDQPVDFSGLNLKGTITGALTTPDVTFTGSVAQVRTSDTFVSLTGDFDVRFSPRGIVLKAFSWTTTAGDQVMLTGTLPYNPYARRFIPGRLGVDGLFLVPNLGSFTAFLPEEFRMPGTLNGTLKISGTGERPEVVIDFHAKDVRFPASLPVAPPEPVSVDAVVFLVEKDLRVDTLSVSGSDLNISISGKWHDMGDLLKGMKAEGLPGTLDLQAALLVDDIGRLSRGLPGIRRMDGKVKGSLTVSGRASDPDISGQLSFVDGRFRSEAAIPPLRDIQARFIFEQRTATIEHFTGTVGGAQFVVEGNATLPVDGGEPEAALRLRGSNLLLYRSENIGIRGDADITVKGKFTAPAFAGTVAITDGKLRKNLNWLAPLHEIGRSKAPVNGTEGIGFSFRKSPMKDATFDIQVTSANPFLIKSNVARGELRPDLKLRGTGETPLITGVIYIDSSRVMLPAGRLTIQSGLIRFPENSPNRPLLEINGSSKILGYDINMTVEGSYDEPTVALSSVPPLPQDALLLLLLTGRLPPGVVEQSGAWQGGMKVALYVGKGVLREWFAGDLDSDESLLDRLDVITGRGISREGNETIEAQYRLAEGVLREGDELYLVAERDIYDEFNTGIRLVFRFK